MGWEASCEIPKQTPVYIDNLCRLGLAHISEFYIFTTPGIYEPLEEHPNIELIKKAIDEHDELKGSYRPVVNRKSLNLTELGKLSGAFLPRSGTLNLARSFKAGLSGEKDITSRQRRLNFSKPCSTVADATRKHVAVQVPCLERHGYSHQAANAARMFHPLGSLGKQEPRFLSRFTSRAVCAEHPSRLRFADSTQATFHSS